MVEDTTFIQIPKTVLDCEQISMTSKILYGYILSLSQLKGFCFSTNQYLSESIHKSKRTITESIQELEAVHFIRIDYIQKGVNDTERHLHPCIIIKKE